MQTKFRKKDLKTVLNTIVRRTQRTEITKLPTKVLTVREVYKNKQIITVSATCLNRCMMRI